jgi:hypothetical protein
MDEAQTRSAWPPHSYDNIYYIQEYYESAVMSGKMVDQTRPPLVLVHKDQFVYQLLLRHTLWTLGGRGVWL